MNYYLYKLEFSASVHFGESDSSHALGTSSMTFCADTLFSALCCTLAQSGREAEIERFVGTVREGRLLFSDAFPYQGDELYIPRPISSPPVNQDEQVSSTARKTMKKLQYIPISMWPEYLGFLDGKSGFDAEKAKAEFGKYTVVEKVSLRSVPLGEDSEPYSVGSFSFDENCGLYGVLGYEDEDELAWCLDLLKLLGLGGIGGKRSSGYGKFNVSEDSEYLDSPVTPQSKQLADMLYQDADSQMLISASLPCDDELERVLEGASFKLVRRGGFAYTTHDNTPQKKATQYFICSGSVFNKRFSGDVFNVSESAHPVLRYGKPMFLGVTR